MAEKQYEPPMKVEPIEGLDAKRQVRLDGDLDPSMEANASSKVRFDEALQKADPSRVTPRVEQVVEEISAQNKKPSIMDIAKEAGNSSKVVAATPSTADIAAQAAQLRQAFERPRATLMGISQAQGEIPPRAVPALSGHIEHADKALQEAASAIPGVETSSLAAPEKPPMMRFLQFLTDGDRRVSTMIDDISKLDLNNQKMSPQLLLAVQVKLGFVQQELEFFTNVLNKSLESTKTVMNVQI